jgi:hypothetical protein
MIIAAAADGNRGIHNGPKAQRPATALPQLRHAARGVAASLVGDIDTG